MWVGVLIRNILNINVLRKMSHSCHASVTPKRDCHTYQNQTETDF